MPTLLEILKDPNYVNANPATKEAIFNRYAPQDENYAKANDVTKEAIRQRFGLGGVQQVQAQEAGNVPEDAPDFTRGISNIIPQIKSTYYGAKVMAAKAAGDKEALLQAAKDYGEASKQAATKETDSFTRAWEKGIGSVVGDWLPYQIGSGVGSLLETLASAGIGAVAGMGVGSIPGAVGGAVGKSLLKKGVKEQAEQIIKDAATKEAGEKAAQAFIQKEAKKALRNYGATTGIAAQSGVHGAGEVTGRAVEELEKQGKTAEDLDMSRVAPAAVVHAVADFVSDKIALGALKGLSGKSTDSFIKDVTKAIGITGLKEVPPETIQTIAERYGAKLSLTDAEALKEYVDTAAAAFAMSVAPGGIGGVRTYLSGKQQDQTNQNKNEIENVSGNTATTTADTLKEDADAEVDPQKEESLAITFDDDAANPAATTPQDAPADIKTPAAPVVQDAELDRLQKDYDDRAARIASGHYKNPKAVQAAERKNEGVLLKINARKAELKQKGAAAYFTADELGEAGTINVTDTSSPSVDTSKDTSTPTPPAQRAAQPPATPPAATPRFVNALWVTPDGKKTPVKLDSTVNPQFVDGEYKVQAYDENGQAFLIPQMQAFRISAGAETTTDIPQPPATPPAATEERPAKTRPNPLAPNDPNSWQDSTGNIHYKTDALLANGKSRVTELIDQEQSQNIALRFTDSKGNTDRTLAVGFDQASKPYWFMGNASEETIRKNIGDTLYNAIGTEPITNTDEYQALVQRIKTALEQPTAATRPQPPAATPTAEPSLAERIGPILGPARPDAKNEEISVDDAAMLRRMVVKTVEDGLSKGKTRQQIIQQIDALTKGGLPPSGFSRINDYLTERNVKEGPAPKLRDVKGKKVEPLKTKAINPDEIRKLGFMEQPSYHSSDQAPPDMRAGIRSAAIESAYDTYDTVDVKNGVQPELNELFEQRRKQKEKYPNAKKSDPLSYMTEKETLDLYKRHSNKRTLEDENNNPDLVREAYADVRNDFVNKLDSNQKALYNFLLDQSLLKEILAKRRRGQKRARAIGYTRQEVAGKLSRKAKKDLKEQIAESLKTDEQIAAEETKADEEVKEAEEKRIATEAEKDAAEQPRRRKITVNIEAAVKDTGNIVDVLAEIADERVNDSVTRVIAKSLDKILEGIGAVGVKDKKPYDYTTAKIVFGEVEGNNDGKFDPATNTITLRGQDGKYTGKRKLDQVALHEILHYLTDHVFDNKQAYLDSIKDAAQRKEVAAAMNRLDNNFRFIKSKFGNKYNIGTMKEFISELYSNPNFQIDLANLRAPGKLEFGGITNMFTQIGRNIATALGFGRPGVTESAGALQQLLDDVSLIVSLPTPDMQGTAISYSTTVPPPTPPTQTPKQPTRKKAQGIKPSRTNDLNDNTGYEIAEYQHPRSLKGIIKLIRQPSSWRAIATKFQNDRYPIKRWEDMYDGARKIFYEGVDKINNIYTQITLSTSRAKNFYNRYVKPAHEKLDNAIINFAKASNQNTDQALGFIHRLLEALHEPERRRVKYIMTVPLSTDPNLGLKMNGKPVSAADVRASIVDQLNNKVLTEQEARNLRATLDKIISAKRPDGKSKYIDPSAPRSDKNAPAIPLPQNPQQAAAIADINNELYNVIGLGDDTTTAQQVVAKRIQQYQQHPQKAEIDAILAAMREFNGPNGITTQLSKYANYWSDFVSNRVAFYDFQNYAPFKGKSKFDEHSEIDQLLDFDGTMMGRELQDAAYAFDGRITVSDNPLLQTISDAIRASMRAGRKELTQSIKNALEKGQYNPNGQGILKGSVKAKIPFKDRMNKDIINKYKGESTIFHYNKDGSIDVLFIEDPKLRNAIRRTYKATNPFTEKANQVTSFLGKMHTRWNYNFAPLNFVRDVLTNAWAIGAEMGPKEAARFIGQIASKVVLGNAMPKAMRVAALYQEGGEKAAQELDRLAAKDSVYRDMVEFIKEGGMVSYLQGLSLKSNFEELQKDLGKNGIVKNAQQLNKFLDIWVEMFELASRSAAYGVAKRNAMARPGTTEAEAKTRAAAYAKNLANFEQVGEWGKTMGAFFMFFRPSATGAVRAIEAVAPAFRRLDRVVLELPKDIQDDSAALAAFKEQYAAKQKNARLMSSALFGLGMVSYVMSSMLSDDDELGRNAVLNDNMEQWTRFLRFHIPKSLTGGKEYVIQIPWGFGLGAFAASGAQLMSVMYGKESLSNALANIFLQISLDSFVPLPVSRMSPTEQPLAFFVDSITPSVARPLVEFLINKNGLGQDIYNDANRRMGDAYLGGDKIPEIWKTVSREMFNETTGAIDISPNTLYFLANSYIDGVSRLFELGYGVTDITQGRKDFNPKTDLPLFGSFFGARSSVDTREYAKIEKELKEKERRLNTIDKLENPVLMERHLEKFPFDEILVDMYNKEKGSDLKDLQSEANEIRLDPNLTPKDRDALLKINKMEQNLLKYELIQEFKAYGLKP